ncbi:MAG: hypothetical protein DRO88_06930 [Promethearchaeia archaeon]|nr:MAG: hypothetical protein DRO88_06930 [Candidatus Lokiarchaeia archaeon]
MGMFTRKKKKLDSPFTNRLTRSIYIKQIAIHSNSDFTILKHNLLDGHIMVCDLSPLVKIAKGLEGSRTGGNKEILHNQLQQIKKYCMQHGGNVTKLKDSILLITPNEIFKLRNLQ